MTESLPDGRVDTMYVFAMSGACSFGLWWVDGDLPPGLSFTSDGLFIGTPQIAGIYFLNVTWEDRHEDHVISSVTKAFTLTIHEADAPESGEDPSEFFD
ncbi:MAG: hypothetical protein JRF54_03645 [Deltaproteobacteria bacterium]|nr:hypothetical protein [Deltaproteobacteria bacterium]